MRKNPIDYVLDFARRKKLAVPAERSKPQRRRRRAKKGE